ncbi:PAS domain-containing sensor histidine kinase [Halarcobacter ebronensis]|uniref:histidine kinase n=1 Tax=Halarcobacter ebronensis TaxID=1462615 RepID=A0A4Q1ANC0_9BACT|nr:PAS domain-containing sensor histidine kinase [Halarcobacter ebronensis]QKF82625.1 PAS sensor-containing signal transduction histidine kinase [Halarcobacter ebronensis]RXK07367.1 hypothetical protein CRV07_02570 [Halarcobacter ebronensis]
MTEFLEKNFFNILEATFSLSNQSIFLIDEYGRFVFANNNALNYLDYTLPELQRLKVWEVDIVLKDENRFYERFSEIKLNDGKNNTNSLESLHKKKNGEIFPVEIHSRDIIIDKKEYLISYVKDISSRVKRTEKIDLYFELIESSRDMIFLIDKKSELIEFANRTVSDNLGYDINELKSMRISEFRFSVEGKQKIEIDEVFRRLEKEENLITFAKYKCKDGTFIPVETSIHAKSYLGRDFAIAISRDIRDRVEIEEKKEELNWKLKEYNRTLHQEIAKVKKELIEYEDIMKKQSKMAAMGEMLENIAHQWRQPLSAVSVLSSGMILQNEEGILNKDILTSGLNTISEQVQYLSKTIDDFRNFFKPNKEKSRFQIEQLIDSAIKLINSRYNHLSIEFIKKIDNTEIYSYENELLQVILNIINNAVDELIKKRYKKAIFIKSLKENSYLSIQIIDNGGGVSQRIIDRIFEPYFTTKHSYQGTGIGLYMSKNIMKHLNGTIEVKNIEIEYNNKTYVGACFELKIPLEQD